MQVELGCKKKVYLPRDSSLYEEIKAKTTFKNPAYEQAMRYSGYDSVRIPQNLFYYEEFEGGLIVPRGLSLPDEEIVEDRRIKVTVPYPNFNLPLRGVQKLSADSYLSHVNEQCGDGVCVQHTGSGKSVTALYLAYRLRQKALIIMHKDDLIMGWRKDIEFCLGIRPKKIGLIKGKTRRIGEQITLATVQTLSRLSEHELDELAKEFGMVIVDEFHHSASKTYSLVDNFFPAFYRLGLTATDLRNDGLEKVLNLYFGDVVYRATDEEAKEAIVPANKVFVVIKDAPVHYSAPSLYMARQKTAEVDFAGEWLDISFVMGKGFIVNAMDINGKRVAIDAVDKRLLNALITEGVLKEKTMNYHLAKQAVIQSEPFRDLLISDVLKEAEAGKSSIVFCAEKEHIELLSAAFSSVGYESIVQCYYGNSTDKKEVIKQRAETREKLITLATYAIATEGTNIKAFERVFMAMPVANEKDLIQAIGRARRLLKGKNDVVVYDYRFPHVNGMEGQGRKRDAVYRKHKFIVRGTGIKRGF